MPKGQGVPQHVAIIMDGNGRWAKRRLLPRSAGHRAGMERIAGIAEHLFSRGVRYLTLFALSTENLSRPKEEVDALFSLFREYFTEGLSRLKEKDVLVRAIGERELLPEDIRALIQSAEKETEGGKGGTLTLAIAYGGRQDILRAARSFVREGKEPTEEEFSARLSTAGLPAPDLLIRTGKEVRISNFLLFECAYAELYFSEKLFPDFSDEDIDRALEDYAARERRFGTV